MELNRRDFLKLGGASIAGVAAFGAMGSAPTLAAWPPLREFPLKQKVSESTTICCYCSVGCGAIVTTYEDGIIKVEGDPDHPINEGALCPKGQAMGQIHQVNGELNPLRLTKPLYRAPGATDWEEKTWDWMINTITQRVKGTRDQYWNNNAKRVDALASLGGGELDNEECYALAKMDRALGIVYLEHCARL